MKAAQGIVSTHAMRMRCPQTQRTHRARLVVPTPRMAPVDGWVVEMGAPRILVNPKMAVAAAVAAQERVHAVRGLAACEPGDDDHVEAAEDETDDRGEDDAQQDQAPSLRLEGGEAGFQHRRATEAADEGVRRAGGEPEQPGDDVPED